jgi:hypothetical protein
MSIHDFIDHAVARKFWITHFSEKTFVVARDHFKRAFLSLEDESCPEIYNQTVVDVLMNYLDHRLTGVIDMCEFNKFTRQLGLLGGVLMLMQVSFSLYLSIYLSISLKKSLSDETGVD